MRSLIVVVPVALALSACGSKRCDEIKVGDKAKDLSESDYTQGVCGTLASSAGSSVLGQCIVNGDWKCVDAEKSEKAQCGGTYHCLVQSDAAGAVSCIKEYCEN